MTTTQLKQKAFDLYSNCKIGNMDVSLKEWNDFCKSLSKRQVYEAVEGICEHAGKKATPSFILNILEIITR